MLCSDDETCFIVEGANDERSLRKMGVKARIVRVSGPKSLSDKLERIPCKKIVVLVDFDEAGKKVEKLIRIATQGRTKVDFTLRRRLSSLLKREIRDVEGLETLMSQLRVEYPSEFGSTLTPNIIDSH